MHAATLHGPRDAVDTEVPVTPRAGHDASSPLCAKQKLLCTRQNRAGRLPSRAWSVGARPMPEGVDPAPLVDFCNQNSPRAQPLISRSPAGASKVALLRPAWVVTPQPLFRTDPRGPAPRSCLRNRALADPARSRERARASRASRPAAVASNGSRPEARPGFLATPTELSRARGRPRLADDASRAGHPEGCMQQELRPNPIHSGTYCRGTVPAPAGEPVAVGDPTPQGRLTPDLPRAASPVPPRRGARSAAPEVPSVHELPTCPWAGLSPGC